MRKMNATKDALLALPESAARVRQAATGEVLVAENALGVLQEIIDAHWKDATHSDMRALIRKAELALKFV